VHLGRGATLAAVNGHYERESSRVKMLTTAVPAAAAAAAARHDDNDALWRRSLDTNCIVL